MDIHDYLNQSRGKISENTKIIKSFDVFKFDYIPENPLMREEVKPIIDALLRYEKTTIPNNLIIYGSRGSGKTLIIKYLKKLFEKQSRLNMLYANCRHLNTSFKILDHFIHKDMRGLSLSEVFDIFSKKYSQKTVVVLDEVDLMSEKDKNKEILYFLSRHPNCYMIVLLSNNPKFMENIDSSTLSTLQPERIYFKNYDALQIHEILKDRALKGLEYHKDEDLHKISSLTYKNTNSDIRVAIKTLFYLVTEPQNGVEANFERARKDIFIDLINDLNDKNLLILRAFQGSGDGLVKPVFKKYMR